MRSTRALAIAVLVLALGAGSTRAEEPPGGEGEAKEKIVAAFLGALESRLDARVRAAEVLRESGRLEEALAAYRAIDELYVREMARLENLLRRLELGRAGAQPPSRVVARARVPVPAPAAAAADLSGRVQPAVEDALAWLAAHQSPNGGWDAANFGKWCRGQPVLDGPDGAGKPLYDPGVTALSALAFLGMGHTHTGDGPYAVVVGKALAYLTNIQDAEGCVGPRTSQHYIYNHGIATIALVEAYGLTLDDRLQATAQRALDFVALSRNPYFAWRYGVKPGDNDTSVTGWMVVALAGAKAVNDDAKRRRKPAPFTIDENAFDGARNWLDKMTDRDYGRVGYIQRGGAPARPQELIDKFPGDRSEAMTAVGLVVRLLTGEHPRQSELIAKGADLLVRMPPVWSTEAGSIDMYYWYYGTAALSRVGGDAWERWRTALLSAVVPAQRQQGEDPCGYRGSWDPVGPWGPDGGRVYATALMALALETVLRADAQ